MWIDEYEGVGARYENSGVAIGVSSTMNVNQLSMT